MEKERRTERVMVRITPSLKKEATELAAAEGRTFSNLVEHLLIEGLRVSKNKKRAGLRLARSSSLLSQ